MKELSIKEKAKAYDEALERAKELLEIGLKDTRDKRVVLSFFPELKENGDSEDEKIRKSIIEFVKQNKSFHYLLGVSKEDALAWLEKKGEQKLDGTFVNVDDVREDFVQEVYRVLDADSTNDRANQIIDAFDNLPTVTIEKQSEQKSAMIQWKGDNLKEVVDFTGVYKEGFEKWFHNSWEEYEKYVHEHNNIFKIFNEDGSHMEVPVGAWIIKAPDGYNTASRFVISPILTELSIESNFKFKKAIECIENYVNSFPHSQRPEIWQHINFLKSFKDRVQPQPNQEEWSEEDIAIISRVISIVKWAAYSDHSHPILNDEGATELIDWLKSLKDRYAFKPSEEQMVVLNDIIINGHLSNANERILKGLQEQLKKLKD